MSDEDLRARMTILRDEARDLQANKPRPIQRLYGTRGPTPEQAERWRAQSKAWNRAWRAYLDEYKLAVGISNQRYEATHGEEGTAVARAVTGVATRAIERDVAEILLEEAIL